MSEENTTPCAEPENISPEERLKSLKKGMAVRLAHFHNTLFNHIQSLPIDSEQKKNSLQNLCQATMWADNAIKAANIQLEEPIGSGELNDAIESRIEQENDSEEHKDGNQVGSEAITSCCDSIQPSPQEQEQAQEEVNQVI